MRAMRRAMTLIEVLVCVFMMGLFTTMVATAMVAAYQHYRSAEDRLVYYRNGSSAIELISQKLALCCQVYSPAPWRVMPDNSQSTVPSPTFSPSVTNGALIFAYNSYTPTGPVPTTVGYMVDTTGRLIQLDYLAGTSYTAPLTSLSRQTLASSVSRFQVTAQPGANWRNYLCLQLDLDVSVLRAPLLTFTNRVPLPSIGVASP